jgi:hypothetical protein
MYTYIYTRIYLYVCVGVLVCFVWVCVGVLVCFVWVCVWV